MGSEREISASFLKFSLLQLIFLYCYLGLEMASSKV